MQLHVSISGLVLIVDDPTDNVVHLIVPLHHVADPTQHHHTWIVPDPSTGASPEQIDGYEVDLTSIANDAALGRPNTGGLGALDLAKCAAEAGRQFPRKFFHSPDRPLTVGAHIKLKGGTFLGERPICLARPCGTGLAQTSSVVRWVAEVNAATVVIPALTPIDGAPGRTIPPIRPGVTRHVWLSLTSAVVTPSHPGDIYGPLGPGNPTHYAAFDHFWPGGPVARPAGCTGGGSPVFTFPTICPPSFIMAAP